MALIKQIIKSPTFSTLSVFAGGNLFVAVLSAIGGLVQARWIEPEVLGEFRKYGILTTYLSFGMIFVHDGLVRQYPYLVGKGDVQGAMHIAGVAKWWYSFITILYTAFFSLLTIIALIKEDYRGVVGWGAQIPGAIAMSYGLYLGVMYRTSAHFKRLSYNNVISSLLGVLELIFVKVWGYWGMALRFSLMNLTSVWINHHHLPVKTKALFNFRSLYNLSKISLRFSIPGYLHSSALVASVNALILYYCGEPGLGVYALAVMVQGMAMTFSNSLNQIFYVKISTKYGETENVYDCLEYAKVPAILAVATSVVLAGCLCAFIGPFIRILLPAYVESIPVIMILSLTLIIHAASLPLLTIGSALWYKTFTTMCIVNFCISISVVMLLPKTPIMVALATILGSLSEMVLGYFSLLWNYRRNSRLSVH